MGKGRYVRAMGAGELYRSAFELYRRHFSKLVLAYMPIVLVSLVVILGTPMAANSLVGLCAFQGIMLILQFTIPNFIHAAVLVTTSSAVLGRPIGVLSTYRRVLSAVLLGRMIGASILASLVFAVGFLLLVIPGIIFLVHGFIDAHRV